MKSVSFVYDLLLMALFVNVAVSGEPSTPSVFWASDPIEAGQTVLVTGSGLAQPTDIRVQRLGDGAAGSAPAGAMQLEGDAASCAAVQPTNESLKFPLPKKLGPGIYRYEIKTAAGSVSGLLNRPALWWVQGDVGPEASPGGWLRLFGKNLVSVGRESSVALQGPRSVQLKPTGDQWSLEVKVPADLPEGTYLAHVQAGRGGQAGWSEPVEFKLQKAEQWSERIFNVREFGAGGASGQDDTPAVAAALAAANAAGGGVVYFPRGIYLLSSALTVPCHTVLRGEGTQLVSLVWPDTETPPKYWISGTHHFGIENLTLYCSNYLTFLGSQLTGPDIGNIFLRKVRVRADIYRGPVTAEQVYERFRQGRGFGAGHYLLELGGRGVFIEDCDLYSSGCVMILTEPRGGVVRNNRIGAGRLGGDIFIRAEGLIVEKNYYYGADLQSWNGVGGGYGNCAHVYLANNSMNICHGGYRESMTSDAPGGFYYGLPLAVGTNSISVNPERAKPAEKWIGQGVYVVSGAGMGQLRRVAAIDGDRLVLEQPWQALPDLNSRIVVTPILGQWLVVNNQYSDVGIAVQFYGISWDCIVAGNSCTRGGGYQAIGKSYGKYDLPAELRPTHQPTWYCQFLNNSITEGAMYRGGANNSVSVGESVIGVIGAPPAADWPWPMAFAHVVRGNCLESAAKIHVGGKDSKLPVARDVVVEDNIISKNRVGVELNSGAVNVLVRNNRFQDVDYPLAGLGADNAAVDPQEQLGMWLESVATAIKADRADCAALLKQVETWRREPQGKPLTVSEMQERRRHMALTLWKQLGAATQSISPQLLAVLVGLRLEADPARCRLKTVLENGEGGAGEVKLNAVLASWSPTLTLTCSVALPEGWQLKGSPTEVRLQPGATQLLEPVVQVPAGCWGEWSLPLKITAQWEGVPLHATLAQTVGHGLASSWVMVGPFSNSLAAPTCGPSWTSTPRRASRTCS